MLGSIGLTSQSVAPASVVNDIDEIRDLVGAELTLQEANGTIVSAAGEQTVYINNAPLGSFDCRCFIVDLDAMLGGDTMVFRVYYRIGPGGGLQLQDYQSYTGADGGLANSKKLVAIDLYPTRFGVRVSVQRTGGADRSLPWEVLVEN